MQFYVFAMIMIIKLKFYLNFQTKDWGLLLIILDGPKSFAFKVSQQIR